ncbi:MAG: type 1 periplasmic binding fold superfamily protein [Bacteroidetes bacterium]|nr:MAG: type 1 periplasmic binding fold superfamily protein [Bacteroidota bacterium]PTM12776.1 MAG: type 1 periplasmic binding fold superfamily protein [Bacteroidota bacterium]
MSISNNILWFTVLSLLLLFASCGDDDVVLPVEEELITTLTAVLTPSGGGAAVTLSFTDPDGDGGAVPVITGGILAANTSYTMALTLLNESVSPADDITAEILAENAAHQFFFAASPGLELMIAYADQDANGDPVGLATTVAAGAAGTGTFTITLRHEPDKGAAGVATGDLTNAGGETDIEVAFPVTIQ